MFRDYPPSRHYVAEQHQALKRRPARSLSKTARRTTAAKDELIRATAHRALHGWAATDQLTRAAPRASAAASPWLPQLHEERHRSRCPRSLAQPTKGSSWRRPSARCCSARDCGRVRQSRRQLILTFPLSTRSGSAGGDSGDPLRAGSGTLAHRPNAGPPLRAQLALICAAARCQVRRPDFFGWGGVGQVL